MKRAKRKTKRERKEERAFAEATYRIMEMAASGEPLTPEEATWVVAEDMLRREPLWAEEILSDERLFRECLHRNVLPV